MNTQQSRPTHFLPDRSPLAAGRLAILLVTAAACLTASAFHAGLTLVVGSATLAEPALPPAAIVEGAIGILLAASLLAQLATRSWARQLTLNAYVVGVLGFALGIAIVTRNPGIQTPFNVGVHVAVFPLLVIGLALEVFAWRRETSGRRPSA
jgi:hypothetical protein